MKKHYIKHAALFVAAIFFFVSLNASSTNSSYKLKVDEGSKIWVEGDSTMHAYKSVISVPNINSEALSKIKPDDSLQAVISDKKYIPFVHDMILNMILKIHVKNFHSSTPGFDSKFYETLKAEDHPDIVFKPSKYTIVKDTNDSSLFYIKSEGLVKIAAQEKTISVTTTAKIQNNTITLTGQKDLLMTDFGLTPPVLLFVKADDKLTVKWNLILSLVPGN